MQLKQELLDNPPNCLGPLLGSQQTVHNQSFAVLVCWFVSCSSPINTGRGGGFVLQACVLGDAEFLRLLIYFCCSQLRYLMHKLVTEERQ